MSADFENEKCAEQLQERGALWLQESCLGKENIGCHVPWGVCIGAWQDRSWKHQLNFVCSKKFGIFNCDGWSVTESDFCFRVFFWPLEKRLVDGGGLEYSCRKQEGRLGYAWMQNSRGEEMNRKETLREQRVYWRPHVQPEGKTRVAGGLHLVRLACSAPRTR